MENDFFNPWKGLDSYNTSDSSLFYGRREETEALANAILTNQTTILYGPSGVGKSSILKAGVIPLLLHDNYLIVNINMREIDFSSGIPITSQIMASIEEEALKQNVEIVTLVDSVSDECTADSLWFFFHSREFWSQQNKLLAPLIIIDQFEELFKEGVNKLSVDTFFCKLDELSNSVPPLSIREHFDEIEKINDFRQSVAFHFVFSLREDFLPRLDDYVYSMDIHELKKSRFGISSFNKKQAIEIITKPVAGLVSEEVAKKIIDILSSQDTSSSYYQKIEPFLLSLYMYRVYEQMIRRKESIISDKLINEIGQDVVSDYYLESMSKVSPKAMRHLEAVLLTEKGHRDSISIDRLKSSGKVKDKELESLLSARILKKSTVNNVERLEFTHDVLSKYAQQNRENRKQDNKSVIISGILGVFISIAISFVIGWIMIAKLTYIFIPLLIPIFVFSACNIVKAKQSLNRKWFYMLILAFIPIGILIDLAQIVPGIGFICFGISAGISLLLTNKLRKDYLINPTSAKTIIASILIWIVSFTLIPILCYGYNTTHGLNLARSHQYSRSTFYVKNSIGKYGLRNRKGILVEPTFDTMLIPAHTGFIAKQNGFYGLLDPSYNQISAFEYDGFKIENEIPYFYKQYKEITDNGLGIEWSSDIKEEQKDVIRKIVANMVFIKGDSFSMGTNLDKVQQLFPSYIPQNGEQIIHQVTLTDFYLNKYEVTLNEWKTIMEYDARLVFKLWNDADSIDNPQMPVYKISYGQCEAFVNKLNHLTGLNFSLPTEAQWEYAATGGSQHSQSLYSGSSNLSEVGWYSSNSEGYPHSVGSLAPNSLGLYDMTGNLEEYCKDCLSPTFYSESDGETNPCCNFFIDNSLRKIYVSRGGSFRASYEYDCLVTKRIKAVEDQRYEAKGFRLALNINSIRE